MKPRTDRLMGCADKGRSRMRASVKALLTITIVLAAVLGCAGVAQAHPDETGQTCQGGSGCHTYGPTLQVGWNLVSTPGQDPAVYDVPVGTGEGWAVLDATDLNVGHGSQEGTIALSAYGHYTLWVSDGTVVNYLALPFRLHPTTINIARSTSAVKGLKPFELSGVLTPGLLGDHCIVEVHKPGSTRWSYSSVRSGYAAAPAGGVAWWYRYGPKLKGTYSFRARFAGDADRAASLSGVVSVAVR